MLGSKPLPQRPFGATQIKLFTFPSHEGSLISRISGTFHLIAPCSPSGYGGVTGASSLLIGTNTWAALPQNYTLPPLGMSPAAQICSPLSGPLSVIFGTMWVRLPNIRGSVAAGSVAEDLWPPPAVWPLSIIELLLHRLCQLLLMINHPFLVEKPKKEVSKLFIENPLEACNPMAIYSCVISQ